MRVRMLVQTIDSPGGVLRRLAQGQVLEVEDSLGAHWEQVGIAEETNAKVTGRNEAVVLGEQAIARRAVERTDLRIGALHGDVDAARRLDRLDAEPVADADGAPPPDEDDGDAEGETTGESARNALGGGRGRGRRGG